MTNFKYFLITLIISATVNCSAQVIGLDILGDKETVSIDFKLNHKYILVDINIEDKLPLTFIFDTGAEQTILFDKTYSDLLGLSYDSKIKVVGSNLSESVDALICRKLKIRVDELDLVNRDILVLEKNYLKLDEMTGVHLHGILGASFFQNTVVEIDYKKEKIHFHHPSNYTAPKNFEKLDLQILNNKPYLDCEVIVNNSNKIKTKMLIDTGAALAFLLHTNTSNHIEIPENVIVGNLGIGISGFVTGYVGKTSFLEFGDFAFTNVLTNFQDIDSIIISSDKNVRDGLLGNSLLSRFHTIINYQKQELYLKARKNYNQDFDYDKTGMFVLAYGPDLNHFLVSGVIHDSPAERAGIKPGDIIMKMGFLSSKVTSLTKLLNRFSGKEGKTIRLKIKRDDKTFKVKFQLKDMLKNS